MTVVLRKSPLESSGYLQRATYYKAEDFLEEKDISKQTKGNFDGGKLWSIAACSASTTNFGNVSTVLEYKSTTNVDFFLNDACSLLLSICLSSKVKIWG